MSLRTPNETHTNEQSSSQSVTLARFKDRHIGSVTGETSTDVKWQ